MEIKVVFRRKQADDLFCLVFVLRFFGKHRQLGRDIFKQRQFLRNVFHRCVVAGGNKDAVFIKFIRILFHPAPFTQRFSAVHASEIRASFKGVIRIFKMCCRKDRLLYDPVYDDLLQDRRFPGPGRAVYGKDLSVLIIFLPGTVDGKVYGQLLHK